MLGSGLVAEPDHVQLLGAALGDLFGDVQQLLGLEQIDEGSPQAQADFGRGQGVGITGRDQLLLLAAGVVPAFEAVEDKLVAGKGIRIGIPAAFSRGLGMAVGGPARDMGKESAAGRTHLRHGLFDLETGGGQFGVQPRRPGQALLPGHDPDVFFSPRRSGRETDQDREPFHRCGRSFPGRSTTMREVYHY